jgi:hypothetical protein
MDSIEVTARFDPQGKIIPLSFMWQGRVFKITSIGRNWQAADEYHILVMDQRNQTYHLIYKSGSTQWYLFRNRDIPPVPHA